MFDEVIVEVPIRMTQEMLQGMYPAQYLNAQRNQGAPVSKLPEEILLRIFTSARDASYDPRATLRTITHACRHWRDIAITAPLLWTRYLSSSRPKWTTLALQRTQRAHLAPLEIDLHLRDGISDVAKSLLTHTSHASKLKMTGRARHLATARELMDEVTPFLKELHISCIDDVDPALDDTLALPFKLLPTKFRLTHHLRHLELNKVDIDFNSPLLRNLTTLSLRRISPESLPTWTELKMMLHRMPLLSHLTLEHVFPAADLSVLSHTPVCPLLLDYISIECVSASQIQTILSYLFFLQPKDLYLRWDEDDVDYISTFRIIGIAIHGKDLGNSFDHLQLEMAHADGRLDLAASRWEGPSIHISVPNRARMGGAVIMARFVDLLCLGAITELDLDSLEVPCDLDALLLLTDKMPFLEHVAVWYFTAFDFFEVLRMKSATLHDQQICLPGLKLFSFRGTDFSGYEEWVTNEAMAVLATRREHGVGLARISFDFIKNLSPEMVAEFEEEVESVCVVFDTW